MTLSYLKNKFFESDTDYFFTTTTTNSILDKFASYCGYFALERGYLYYGQGDYYRGNTIHFQKDREKHIESLLYKKHDNFYAPLIKRKTAKSLKEPVRLKGWKGKR